jgi:hypothetical protein
MWGLTVSATRNRRTGTLRPLTIKILLKKRKAAVYTAAFLQFLFRLPVKD